MFKRAHAVLKENVRALMAARRVTQVELAMWCGHQKSWANKWLNGEREIQFKDLDRLADFFGLLPYQLFTPGVSGMTERRIGTERRAGRDRRSSTDAKLGLQPREHASITLEPVGKAADKPKSKPNPKGSVKQRKTA